MPLVWVLVLFIYSFFSKNKRRKKASAVTGLLILFIFSNDFLVNEAFLLWEKKPVTIASMPVYQTGIVLTGMTHRMPQYNDRVFFDKGADRLLHTVQLYKAGKIKKILITGGSGYVFKEGIGESDALKNVFVYCGVPEKDIIIENKSRNTVENARFSKKMIADLHLQPDYLLITSAFHMRRAEGCFVKAGLEAAIFPVDYYSGPRDYTFDQYLIPSEFALAKSALLIHELTGFIVYKLLGYC